ncbi:hypothetical protein A2773_07035 [Candidatus Gottesmanbacteria bacterium RIFCSPHIGHO2_01_FULL_39_10]|uniref:Methylated-DNA-[protein]-cysteine S-methyltransferase DNA binding domain-containing protein n=1 Tax=Candidatus Gottesmanbacteria bacterium RIFCSPHIGHO2_01_FULL_39_10 TaxID=1798375 RepID=A0A1F5ZRU3_9BACT|nr:MAG: hypothetical protein A2773_07035 [Candidatus Gottesmanbacteria bacterium RIFCSPHIGHO2_01_FULL_39_10]
MKNNLQKIIFEFVKKIPKGKVVTYGYISDELKKYKKSLNAHVVGWVLHKNKSSSVPCHRVVDRNGRLAPNFAFDGAKEQRRRLEAEGVTFVDEMHVNLDKHLWKG